MGLVEGKEQGRLREKLALRAVVVPYPQAPQVCQTLLGGECHAMTLRRVALREAAHFTASGHHHTLPKREGDRLYLEVDGHLCPTREPKDGPDDHGYREAKAVLAFSGHEVAEVRKKNSHEILHKILQAQITDSEAFRSLFTEVYRQAHGERAAEVIVLADGARWIWTMGEDLLPHAVQILDFSHAKQYLWEAAKIIYGEGLKPWPPVGEGTRKPYYSQTKCRRSLLISRLSWTFGRPWLLFSITLSRIRTACAMGPIGRRATSSARGRLRVRANNSLLAASKALACGGM